MKTPVLSLFVLLIAFTGTAIAKDADEIEELKKRKLIVALVAENEEDITAIGKDQKKLAEYKQYIQEVNTTIKKNVEKYWTLHKQFEYKTYAEVELMKKDPVQTKKYAYLALLFYTFYTKELVDLIPVKRITYLQVFLMEKKKPIQWTTLPKPDPSEADYVSSLRILNNHCEAMGRNESLRDLAKENGPKLKEKTLLVPQSEMGDLTKAKIMEAYPYKFEIVNQPEIDKAILASDPRYAFIMYSDQQDGVWEKRVVLADNGQLAGFALSTSGRKPLKKGDFSSFTSYVK